MLTTQRIIWDDNATLKDMSAELNDLTAGTYTLGLVAADDKVYIGSDLPFNHRYFDVSTVNDVASVVSVEIWDGTGWVTAVDVIDETKVSGVTLAQSGIISWQTPRTESWELEETTEDIAALASLKIYNLYWVRFTFSVSLKSTTALRYVGHKFAKDADLMPNGYPDLNSTDLMAAFETGKTNWNDQHVAAAEGVIRYLQQKNFAKSINQILEWRAFNIAAVHKLATIIYSSFGPDYEERRALAEKEFYSAMGAVGLYKIDRNEDGKKDVEERESRTGLRRT